MNILGEGFDSYVIDQIYIRQQKYASGYGKIDRDIEDITFLNSKTSFARLMSSVEVTSGASNYDYVKSLNLTGLDLAKDYVLFAGTSKFVSSSSNNSLTSFNDLSSGYSTYGMGGLELGYRPMPGIESVEVKTDGDGFTNSATVKIKAFNRNQLEIIDVLYLRLGYYMLLEWGHTVYYDNNSNLVKDPNDNSLQSYFFDKSNTSIRKTLAEIKKKREKSNGNYDALFGQVMNFNWKYNPDNTFDITLYLRSVGNIIEGLKMNTQKTISSGSVSTGGTDPYTYANGISNLYHNVKTNVMPNYGTSAGIGSAAYYVERAGTTMTFKGDKTFLKVDYSGAPDSQYYIKLNRLLAEFQYNYIYTLNGDPSEEILDIDNKIDTNLIQVNELVVSTDPRICVVSRDSSGAFSYSSLFPKTTVSGPTGFRLFSYLDNFLTSVGSETYGKLMNVYVNFEFLMKKMDSLVDEKTNKVSLKQFLNSILKDISRALGGVNQLEVNITEDRILRIIDKNPTSETLIKQYGKQRVALFDAIGYIDYFLSSKQGAVATPYTSFLKNISIQTQIPPDFSNIISIGAAANNQVVGEDATAFSRLSKGLKTRFAEKIVDGKDATPPGDITKQLDAALAEFDQWVGYASGPIFDGRSTWQPDRFESLKSILNGLSTEANKIKATNSKSASSNSGFIPVNISLTMDGLSGMKVFERFALESSFLPTNYPENMDVLIKSITHKIKNNVWDTTIESIIVGKSSTSLLNVAPVKTSPTPTFTAPSPGGSAPGTGIFIPVG